MGQGACAGAVCTGFWEHMPRRNEALMVKRPLGLGCFGAAVVLFLLTLLHPAPYTDYGAFQRERVTVTGIVYKKETATQQGEKVLALYLKSAKGTRAPAAGEDTGPAFQRVLCYLKAGQEEPEMGAAVRLQGTLSVFERGSNPGQFDAWSYYQISKISYRLNQAMILAKTRSYNRLGEMCYQLKGFLAGKLEGCLSPDACGVMQAMLLGEKGNIGQELKALYQQNGIAHILAISGLHVSLLGMGLYRLLRKCGAPMKGAAAVSSLFLFLYVMTVGLSVSSVRAAVMFAFHMAAVLLERTYDMLTAAAVAAVLTLAGQPLYLYHSGFLFSFGCVFGIGLVLPGLLEGKYMNIPPIKAVMGGLGMAAITLPVYLWFYYQFPVYSVFLNLLVIPLMAVLMGAGLLLLLTQLLCPGAGEVPAFLVQGILEIYRGACQACQGLPGNLLTPGQPAPWQIMVYLLLAAAMVMLGKRIRPLARWGIMALAVLVLVLSPRRGLTVAFLDVGQGDCIYIENGNGGRYLVDGGSSSVSRVGKYRVIPFLKSQGASRLEGIIVTHPDEDHCNGIREVLETGRQEGISVSNLVLPDVKEGLKNQAYRELEETARRGGVPVSYISRGQKIENGGLTITCLSPVRGEDYQGTNEYSVVLGLSYGAFRAMLTGDLEGPGEQELVQFLEEEGLGGLTVLKAAHHGSKASTPDELLDSQRPAYTVISCGKNNSYGHPHKELTGRLEAHGTKILITYETGAVRFCTDGRRVSVFQFLDPGGGKERR